MVSNPERTRTYLLAFAALLLSAAFVYFGTGIVQPAWWATWLAALPVLYAAPRLSGVGAFGLSALAWFLGSLNLWRYLHNILRSPNVKSSGLVPYAIAVLILAVPACVFGLAVACSRLFTRRGAPWRAALALPIIWVSYEYLMEFQSPHSTFGNLAYSQMNLLPLLQIAAVTGVWGISFCLFLLAGTAAALLNHVGTAAQRRALAICTGLFFAAVMAFGLWRLHSSNGNAASVVVGLAASDLPQNVLPQDPEQAGRLFRDYLEQAAPLAARGAQVIVLPEKLAVVVDPATRDSDALFQAFADKSHANVVVGVIRRSGSIRFNEARIYSPSHVSALTYDKHHMLPAFESRLQPGTTRTLLPEPSGLWGIAICKDMDFPALSRQYGADGTGLLLVPAWDFVDDGWLHDRMAIMRGVESGFSIARSAKEGLLTISDDRGRVLVQRSSAAAPFSTLTATVPVRHDETLYARFGDWFAWLNVGTLLLILATLAVSREH